MKNNFYAMTEATIRAKKKFDETLFKYRSGGIIDEKDCELVINAMNSNALIQNSPVIFCILEYSTQSYVYVSSNIKNEIKVTAKELIEGGLNRGMLCLEENHRSVFLEKIYPCLFEQYGIFAATHEAKNLQASYNTLMYTPSGEKRWFVHQLSVLSCDENGFPRHALKIISNVNSYIADDRINFNMWKTNDQGERQPVLNNHFFPYELDILFSTREKEIIDMVEMGHSAKYIADKLFISVNTVNTHRRNIARKLKQTQSENIGVR